MRPRGTAPGSLGAIIQAYKASSTRKINQLRGEQGVHVWQRNYHERILRNEAKLEAARQYIALNPGRWDEDPDHPTS